jgi:hypothetical protein
MADSDILRFHSQSLRDYAVLWFDPETRRDLEITEEEAAYHLCEHAAMLLRYTGQAANLAGLMGQPPESRRSIVLAVCRYAACLTLTDTARQLLAEDVLDADQITKLEDLIIERDALEEVLSLAVRLVADLVRNSDVDLRRYLATARSSVAELDDILWVRQDVLSVASRALTGLRAQFAVRPDEQTHWWFAKAATLDESFEQGSIYELLRVAPASGQLAHRTRVVPFSARLFAQGKMSIRLAAADESSVAPVASLPGLVPDLPGVRVLVNQLSPESYQFVFIDNRTGERSTGLEGCLLVGWSGSEERAVSCITSGVAMLRTAVTFDGCRLETADGQLVSDLILDTTD